MPGKLHLAAATHRTIPSATIRHFLIPIGIQNKIDVEKLITFEHYNPHTVDEFGLSPLEHAAKSGSKETIEYLIEKLNALSHLSTEQKCRSLILATSNTKDVQVYLAHYYCREQLITPLHAAAYLGHMEKVLHLLSTNPNSIMESGTLNKTLFYWITFHNNNNRYINNHYSAFSLIENHKAYKTLTDGQQDTLQRDAADGFMKRNTWSMAISQLLKIKTFYDRDWLNLAKCRYFIVNERLIHFHIHSGAEYDDLSSVLIYEQEIFFAIDNLKQLKTKQSSYYYHMALCENALGLINHYLGKTILSTSHFEQSLTWLTEQVDPSVPDFWYHLGVTHQYLANSLSGVTTASEHKPLIASHYEQAIAFLLKVDVKTQPHSEYYQTIMQCYDSLANEYYKIANLQQHEESKIAYLQKAAKAGHDNALETLATTLSKLDSKHTADTKPTEKIKTLLITDKEPNAIKELNTNNYKDGLQLYNAVAEKLKMGGIKNQLTDGLKLQKAIQLLEEAAKNGHKEANEKLGDIYSDSSNLVIHSDYTKALMYFNISNQQKYNVLFDKCFSDYKTIIKKGDIEELYQFIDDSHAPLNAKIAHKILRYIMDPSSSNEGYITIATETKHAMLEILIIRGLEIPVGFPHLSVFDSAKGADKSEAFVIDNTLKTEAGLVKLITDYLGIRHSGNHHLFWDEKATKQKATAAVTTAAATTAIIPVPLSVSPAKSTRSL
jgi:ankyrin repeat protein